MDAEPMSFTDKIVSIFSSPGEVYDNVRQTPITHSTWLVPTLILAVVGALLGYVVMSNPSLSDQAKRLANEQMEMQFEKSIREGKMTAEQAEKAREQMSSFGSIATISRIAGAAFSPFITLFAGSLVYWLLGKGVMKAAAPYWKVAEVIGLALFITVLEHIVTTVLAVTMDNVFASPSLMLLVTGFSAQNSLHLLAAAMNIFTIWYLAVISIGLSRLFQRDLPKVLVLVFSLWLLWTAVLIFGTASLRG